MEDCTARPEGALVASVRVQGAAATLLEQWQRACTFMMSVGMQRDASHARRLFGRWRGCAAPSGARTIVNRDRRLESVPVASVRA